MFTTVDRTDMLVGLYAFPIIKNGPRSVRIYRFENYNLINLRSRKEDIYRLENPFRLGNLDSRRFLKNQKISRRGWNYLNEGEVGYVLDEIENSEHENNCFNTVRKKILLDLFPIRRIEEKQGMAA